VSYNPYGGQQGGYPPYGAQQSSGYNPNAGQPGAYHPYGMYGQPLPQRPPGSTQAMWAHLGPLLVFLGACVFFPLVFFMWVPPLIIRNSAQNKHEPLVRHHTAQALNSNLTALIIFFPVCILVFLMLFSGSAIGIGLGVLIFVAALAQSIAALVYAIIACTKANAGEPYFYPKWIAFPFNKDELAVSMNGFAAAPSAPTSQATPPTP
jgi:uncharacterized Tic20 family protein